MILTIITVIIVLSFLVFIHELGHFLGAKAVGVRILEFSIGFPPKLISKIVGGTEYMISLIPIGGYVRLRGQNFDDENPDEVGNYASKSIWQRFIILVAGPFMNLMVAMLFIPIVFFIGYEIPSYMVKQPTIDAVVVGSEAEKLGLEQHDIIKKINGESVTNWREVFSNLSKDRKNITEFTIQRDNQILTKNISTSLLSSLTDFGWRIHIDPVVGTVAPSSPADKAGFQKGDIIIRINELAIQDWSEISKAIQQIGEKTLSIEVIRNGQNMLLKVKPEWNEENKYWVIGISSQTVRVSESFYNSIKQGLTRVGSITVQTFDFLYKLITRKASTDSVGGPIMIAQMVGQAAHTDISNLISLIAFISLQFAIFNLLPIPALDGGHILFLILEKIKGTSLSIKFRLTMQKIGFSLLMFLILYISVQDGIRIFYK